MNSLPRKRETKESREAEEKVMRLLGRKKAMSFNQILRQTNSAAYDELNRQRSRLARVLIRLAANGKIRREEEKDRVVYRLA